MIHYAETKYGFEWGAVKVERLISDEKRGWVVFSIQTPKYRTADGKDLQVYVTKTGKVRIIASGGGEWKPKEVVW